MILQERLDTAALAIKRYFEGEGETRFSHPETLQWIRGLGFILAESQRGVVTARTFVLDMETGTYHTLTY